VSFRCVLKQQQQQQQQAKLQEFVYQKLKFVISGNSTTLVLALNGIEPQRLKQQQQTTTTA
jgi:hypothetical protein